MQTAIIAHVVKPRRFLVRAVPGMVLLLLYDIKVHKKKATYSKASLPCTSTPGRALYTSEGRVLFARAHPRTHPPN